jgi:hypothetical protein
MRAVKSCECGWMQRGYFVRRMDPDQLFEDGDVDGDVVHSERSVDNARCCQCTIATALLRLRSRGGDLDLRAEVKDMSQSSNFEVGRVSEGPREEGAQVFMDPLRTQRSRARRGGSGHLLTPIVIDDSEDESRLKASESVSSVGWA